MFQKGDLVRIKKVPDQNRYKMERFWGKLGIVMTQVKDDVVSSPNIWKVFIEGQMIHFHKLDLEKVKMSFKTTDEDLKRGDLVRVWSHIIYQDHYKKVSELAVVSRYYRPNVASSGCWLFYNHKGEFSCDLHRVELVGE